MALSKNRIKYIHSLELKKNRKTEKVFLAEGPKLVGDLLGHFPCRFLAATPEWLSQHPKLPVEDVSEVSDEDLSRASLLKTPNRYLPYSSSRNMKRMLPSSATRFAWRWTMCKIREIWVLSFVWQTGLE